MCPNFNGEYRMVAALQRRKLTCFRGEKASFHREFWLGETPLGPSSRPRIYGLSYFNWPFQYQPRGYCRGYWQICVEYIFTKIASSLDPDKVNGSDAHQYEGWYISFDFYHYFPTIATLCYLLHLETLVVIYWNLCVHLKCKIETSIDVSQLYKIMFATLLNKHIKVDISQLRFVNQPLCHNYMISSLGTRLTPCHQLIQSKDWTLGYKNQNNWKCIWKRRRHNLRR